VHFSVARLYPFFWKFPAKKFFCTFHAGGEITVPQDKFVLSRHIYNLIVKLTWKKIDRIFADSEFGINEIELNYRIPRARIDLIHLGSDHLWNLKPKSINLDKSKINIAVIGRWQKYKNVHSILRAFVNLDSNLMSNFNIFLVGKSNMSGKGLVLKSLNKIDKKCVTTFDYLTDNELKFIYQNVNLVIHPSINEGFGLPAFEAFGEGCPVAIHSETPAGFYLSNQNMVFAINMLDLYEITKLFLNSSKFKRVSVKQRRKYLLNNIMTWDQICSQYVEFYLDAFKYDVIKCFLRHD
jgi:glycosyltransferase involved in cell wall biosynthesis